MKFAVPKRRLIAVLLLLPLWALAETPVSVMPLGEVLVDYERRAPAEVAPLNEAILSAEVNAVVLAVHAEVGQPVTAGELLLSFDARDYELELARAEAQLAAARAQLDEANAKLKRAERLGANQYISADELLSRETAVSLAQAQLRRDEVALAVARRQLDKCELRAPFDGVVVARPGQLGSLASMGSPQLHLTQTDRIELNAQVPASHADSLPAASTVYFESRAMRWPVELLRLSPIIDPARRTRTARFAFADAAPEVGRAGELVWRVAQGLLPANLVSRRDGQLGVFIHEQGKAVFYPLPQAQEGRPVALSLPAATEIVVTGREKLQHGDLLAVSR
ncbi:MAG: efflux RND transporter periplasmic adaptor subunit [Xanthomonadales bacterium]|nr:efflux RND transporter periplasmic adaptor subunit [Xanthomonadales bacterium]